MSTTRGDLRHYRIPPRSPSGVHQRGKAFYVDAVGELQATVDHGDLIEQPARANGRNDERTTVVERDSA